MRYKYNNATNNKVNTTSKKKTTNQMQIKRLKR